MDGKLTELQGTAEPEAVLKPAGVNKLEAAVKLGAGAKDVAAMTGPSGKTPRHRARSRHGRLELAPQSAGMCALSLGPSHVFPDDREMCRHGMVMFDALYARCRH